MTEMHWHRTCLPKPTLRALDRFAEAAWLKRSRWYLAGGTALALQLGRRASVDLDFFLPTATFASGSLIAKLPANEWQTTLVTEGTVYGELDGAKVSFIAYPFFTAVLPHLWYGNVRVLDQTDIAVMKIIALSQREKKRDFIDLYWYCQQVEPLEAVLRRVPNQYPSVRHDYHHLLKSLVYFADAEADPEPTLFVSLTWRAVKRWFEQEVRQLTPIILKLT